MCGAVTYDNKGLLLVLFITIAMCKVEHLGNIKGDIIISPKHNDYICILFMLICLKLSGNPPTVFSCQI